MHQCLASVGSCQHANIGMLRKRNCHYCRWRAVKFRTMLNTFGQGGNFIVPRLLWCASSVLRSHLKDRNDNDKRCFLTQIPTGYLTDGTYRGLFYMCLVYFYSELSNQGWGCCARAWPLLIIWTWPYWLLYWKCIIFLLFCIVLFLIANNLFSYHQL